MRQPGEATAGAAAEVCGARGGARVPKKPHPVHLRTKTDVFVFIEEARGRLSFWETEAFLKQRHADLDYTDEDLARDRGDTIDRHSEGGSSDAIKMQAPSVSASGHLRVAEQTYRPPPRPKNNSSPWSTLASSVGDTCPKILRMRRLSIERR